MNDNISESSSNLIEIKNVYTKLNIFSIQIKPFSLASSEEGRFCNITFRYDAIIIWCVTSILFLLYLLHSRKSRKYFKVLL